MIFNFDWPPVPGQNEKMTGFQYLKLIFNASPNSHLHFFIFPPVSLLSELFVLQT